MGLTGQAPWKLGPPQAGVVHAVNAYCYRCPFGLEYPSCEVKCAQDIEQVIRTTTSGHVAALIAEPIQGVGGFITPPKEYFKIVTDIVRKYGGIFISDEVQTAWGRTGGKWFGIEHWDVEPDIITSAKGLGNGLPIGVTIARPEIADAMKGVTISTFGGNPVVTTAAKAVIDYIEEQNLLRNTEDVGAYLKGKLLELKEKHRLIGDVRGMGLLLAHRAGGGSRDQGARHRGDTLSDGSRPGKRDYGGPRRTLRKRFAHVAAHEYRARGRRRVYPPAGRQFPRLKFFAKIARTVGNIAPRKSVCYHWQARDRVPSS